MNNLLTPAYWFNSNPGPFLPQYLKIIYFVVILILIGGFISWFFIKKNENQKLLSQINKAVSDYPDSEENKVHSMMRKKQLTNLERDSW